MRISPMLLVALVAAPCAAQACFNPSPNQIHRDDISLNGGPQFRFDEAVSFVIECDDQAEVDRLWEAIADAGGQPGPCGWIKDQFGLSWQIVPRRLTELLDDPDPERARRAMEAMLEMGKIEVAGLEQAADEH